MLRGMSLESDVVDMLVAGSLVTLLPVNGEVFSVPLGNGHSEADESATCVHGVIGLAAVRSAGAFADDVSPGTCESALAMVAMGAGIRARVEVGVGSDTISVESSISPTEDADFGPMNSRTPCAIPTTSRIARRVTTSAHQERSERRKRANRARLPSPALARDRAGSRCLPTEVPPRS